MTLAAPPVLTADAVHEVLGRSLLVDGFDTPPMVLMGHDPPYAGARMEALGYAKARDVHAYLGRNTHDVPARVRKRLERGVPRGHRDETGDALAVGRRQQHLPVGTARPRPPVPPAGVVRPGPRPRGDLAPAVRQSRAPQARRRRS